MNNSEQVQAWRNRTKQNCIEALGGKCAKCEYDTCSHALDFHHIDPNAKVNTVANMLKNPTKISNIVAEIKKCVLLCGNCHQELHASVWLLSDISIPKFNESVRFHLIRVQDTQYTCVCGKATFNNKYCSKQCTNKNKQKQKIQIQWPNIEVLAYMLHRSTVTATATFLKTSRNAIIKHIFTKYPNRYVEIFKKPAPNWLTK